MSLDECELRDEESRWRSAAFIYAAGRSATERAIHPWGLMEQDREEIIYSTYFTGSVLTIWVTSFRRRWGNMDRADKLEVASCALSRPDAV